MKKSSLALLSAVFVTAIFTACQNEKDTCTFNAMDTFMTIQTYGKGSQKANQKTKEEILKLEKLISTTDTQSELYKINNRKEENQTYTIGQDISKPTFDLIQNAVNTSLQTQTALNPLLYPITKAWGFTTKNYTVPSEDTLNALLPQTQIENITFENNSFTICKNAQIDLGAVGKGYAGDLAIQILKENKIEHALLDLGGNIQAIGSKPDKSEWRIGIKSPWTKEPAAALKIINEAVITSGGYERFFTSEDGKNYIHIFDGKTGYPVDNELASVTIICESGLKADSLSTAIFVMGKTKAVEYWKQHKDFQMILITTDNSIIYTEGLKSKLTLLDSFNSEEIVN